jgi:predicted SAM-dependent methyltransferase
MVSETEARSVLANEYLRGEGIEIGALQKPLAVPDAARVRYVDRLTLEQAHAEYPELGDAPLVRPDIIADAETLAGLLNESYDFVIANHVLEHMKNPLGALENWIRVLRLRGRLYVAVPDHTNPLDKYRPVTSMEHIIQDYEGNTDHDQHYRESAESAFRDRPEVWSYMPDFYKSRDYAIHFHVFDGFSFARLLGWSCCRFSVIVEALHHTPEEHIAIVTRLS